MPQGGTRAENVRRLDAAWSEHRDLDELSRSKPLGQPRCLPRLGAHVRRSGGDAFWVALAGSLADGAVPDAILLMGIQWRFCHRTPRRWSRPAHLIAAFVAGLQSVAAAVPWATPKGSAFADERNKELVDARDAILRRRDAQDFTCLRELMTSKDTRPDLPVGWRPGPDPVQAGVRPRRRYRRTPGRRLDTDLPTPTACGHRQRSELTGQRDRSHRVCDHDPVAGHFADHLRN